MNDNLIAPDGTINWDIVGCRIKSIDISEIHISWDEKTGELAAQWIGESPIVRATDLFLIHLWECYPIQISLDPYWWDIGKRVRLFEWEFDLIAYDSGTLIWTLQRIDNNGETIQA